MCFLWSVERLNARLLCLDPAPRLGKLLLCLLPKTLPVHSSILLSSSCGPRPSQPNNSKAEACLTSWIERREFRGVQLHSASVSLEGYTGAYVKHGAKEGMNDVAQKSGRNLRWRQNGCDERSRHESRWRREDGF
ncbi:hypothetical protein L3X38_018105 [Prunus dulcis]|uniref:Uncharacterized protein n=1 Tax=Prunus dulcis TaxID=3755 RepID=A0AAD4W9E8_PRUDU|nr:hypothetical protein L3X38_018105 [Prunus dulcis]